MKKKKQYYAACPESRLSEIVAALFPSSTSYRPSLRLLLQPTFCFTLLIVIIIIVTRPRWKIWGPCKRNDKYQLCWCRGQAAATPFLVSHLSYFIKICQNKSPSLKWQITPFQKASLLEEVVFNQWWYFRADAKRRKEKRSGQQVYLRVTLAPPPIHPARPASLFV